MQLRKTQQLTLFSLCLISLIACANNRDDKHITSKNWEIATRQVVAQYSPKVDEEFKPYFEHAHIHYPPQKLALLAFKDKESIDVYAKDKRHLWHYIRSFALTAMSGSYGPKLKYHDGQIPEGIYQIEEFNPFSALHLSMMINYPNAFDKLHATLDHRTHLGNNIFIHGNAMSVGCLAIGDKNIEKLFILVNHVGKKNTTVIIAPNDLRIEAPHYDHKHHPRWLSQLYQKITTKLKQFPTAKA